MPTRITVYRRTTTRGQYVGETGVTYQLQPWGSNTDRYTAFDEPVPALLADGWEVLHSIGEEPPILYNRATGEDIDSLRVAFALGIARLA